MKDKMFGKIYASESPPPSCRFRIPSQGGRVLWQVTNVCNYTCSYCIFASGPQKIKGELSTEIIYKTLSDLVSLDFRGVKFTGGEPFVRPDIVDIVEYACNLGMRVDLSTNASLVTKARTHRLRAAGVDMVHVSLDGPNSAVHGAVRGKRTFELTCRGLTQLLNAQIYTRIGCVIFGGNEDKLGEMVDFCACLGVPEIIFSRMEPAGRMQGDYSQVATKSNDALKKEIDDLRTQYATRIKIESNLATTLHSNVGVCPASNRFLFIDNLGRVSPCTWIAEHTSMFQGKGTLSTQSLRNILTSPEFESYRGMIRKAAQQGKGGCPIDWEDFLSKKFPHSLKVINNITEQRYAA